MNKWADWGLKILIAGLLTGVILGFVAPRALGFSSPAKLWRTTWLDTNIPVENLAPGDSIIQNLEIGNEGSMTIYYRIVFIRQGKIWSCDPRGHNLDYRLDWNQGANQHLYPGEIEKVDIEIHLPLSAENDCMGQNGSLSIRSGVVEEQSDAGLYECFFMSIFDRNISKIADLTNALGMICYRSGVPLDYLVNLDH